MSVRPAWLSTTLTTVVAPEVPLLLVLVWMAAGVFALGGVLELKGKGKEMRF